MGSARHDGRFGDLDAGVGHHEKLLKLQLSAAERADLVQFLKSL